jgi:S1-C subfamily serine protease
MNFFSIAAGHIHCAQCQAKSKRTQVQYRAPAMPRKLRNNLRSYLMPALHYLLLLTTLLVTTHVPVAAAADPTYSGRELFAKSGDAIIELREVSIPGAIKAGQASGFLVDDSGLVVSNYHAVASHLFEPNLYGLEYVRASGAKGALEVVAVDILNDLALLRAKGLPKAHLSLDIRLPIKGTRGFSFGNPGGIGQSVVEGTFNGLDENSFRDIIHFTGPINGGMSGGPTLLASGSVVGVNVSRMLNDQLISFVVPAAAVKALLDRFKVAPAQTPAKLRAEIAKQLVDYGQRVVDSLMVEKVKSIQLDRFTVPGVMSPRQRCGATIDNSPERFYVLETHECRLASDIYVDDKVSAGGTNYRHQLVRGNGLGAIRLARAQGSRMETLVDQGKAPVKHFTRWSCESSNVELTGMKARLVSCVRGYRQFPGLYDMRFRVASLTSGPSALVSSLAAAGISSADGARIAKHFLASIRYQSID